jgi:hypothetical protein
MGVSGQRDAPAAVYPRGKDLPVPIGQEAGWAPQPVWTQRLEEKSSYLCRGSNIDRPVVQSVVRQYTEVPRLIGKFVSTLNLLLLTLLNTVRWDRQYTNIRM